MLEAFESNIEFMLALGPSMFISDSAVVPALAMPQLTLGRGPPGNLHSHVVGVHTDLREAGARRQPRAGRKGKNVMVWRQSNTSLMLTSFLATQKRPTRARIDRRKPTRPRAAKRVNSSARAAGLERSTGSQ